ncbi:unnamed protein product [Calypogeia fissa]
MAPGELAAANEKVTRDYAAGIAAGVATVVVGHPFDTIKIKLQTQRRTPHGPQYRSAFHCCTQLLKAEGIKGLYRGATPSFIGVSVESSLLFGSYSQLKTFLEAGDTNSSLLKAVVPAAALAGASASTILCPSELVKCRLQVDAKGIAAGAQHYDGPLDCIRKTIKTEGIQGLFRGLTATCLREAIGNACFFVTYETTRHRMLTYAGLDPMRASTSASKPDSQSQAAGNLPKSRVADFLMETGIGIISGGLSGIAFWTVVLPIDVAKTRIQIARDLTTSRNPLVHLRMIYGELGVRGLYAGLGPSLVRAFPANAAAICAWEATARLLARQD